MREALEYDPEVQSDTEGDDWQCMSKKREWQEGCQRDENEEYSESESRSSHRKRKVDRKLPRLCLDDALIMVRVLSSSELLACQSTNSGGRDRCSNFIDRTGAFSGI